MKDIVRANAGHRCLRCAHPFVVGSTAGQWSACDDACFTNDRHPFGPGWTRHRYEYDGESGEAIEVVEAEWRILTVHHLLTGRDAKRNLLWWNLVALCQRCHLTVQRRVDLNRIWPWPHTEWFRPYAAGWYAYAYLGENLSRDETMLRLDDLLALEQIA